MIIIKIIILYFIQITHTDDFSSKGTRLVNNNVCNLKSCRIVVKVRRGKERMFTS